MALAAAKIHAPAAFVYLEEVASSMDEAASRVGTLPEFSTVFGENQTAARGRRGTKWHIFPHCGLAFTMLVGELPAQTPLAVALAVHQAIAQAAGVRAEIKWPNDILYNGEKLAGILVEKHAGHHLIGIGLNVNTPEDMPEDFPGTTLQNITGHELNREEMLNALLARLHDISLTLREQGWSSALAQAYEKECVTLGKNVLWRPPVGDTVEGMASHLTSDGGLVLKLANGTQKTILSGDIIVSRG